MEANSGSTQIDADKILMHRCLKTIRVNLRSSAVEFPFMFASVPVHSRFIFVFFDS
jgi:hypothetical protein